MRAFTPEISWHNRLPISSISLDAISNDVIRVATGGHDCRVFIWIIDLNDSNKPDIKIQAGLRRHQSPVGAVRFSPQHMLASGDDDGYIYLWRHKPDEDQPSSSVGFDDDGFEDLEVWQQQRVLRGHIEDICDLAWSKDGQFLLSGSVDNSAILWDTTKGTKIWCSDAIKGYVQGVALDPHSQFMVTISSDRTLRTYNFADKRLLNATRKMNIKGKYKAFFGDDTVQTFCRRLEFSADGQFLVAPTARLIEKEPKNLSPEATIDNVEPQLAKNRNDEIECIVLDSSEEKQADTSPQKQQHEQPQTLPLPQPQPQPLEQTKKPKKLINAFLVFRRSSFNKPSFYYPTGREEALCIRFSPVVYKLRDSDCDNFWDIPYRLVFAVATSRSVLIYDSQQSIPIGYVSQIHLARLTDLVWSDNGRLLMVSSYDGYNTLLTFEQGEFGEVYDGTLMAPPSEEEKPDKPATKKGQKRAKPPSEEAEEEATLKTPKKTPPTTTLWRFIKKQN